MKKYSLTLLTIGACCANAMLTSSASAALTTYSSFTYWTEDVVAAGNTVATETFNSYNGYYASPLTGSVGGITWSANADGGLYCNGELGYLSSNYPVPATFTFNPGVTSVGGNIFGTDAYFGLVDAKITVTLAHDWSDRLRRIHLKRTCYCEHDHQCSHAARQQQRLCHRGQPVLWCSPRSRFGGTPRLRRPQRHPPSAQLTPLHPPRPMSRSDEAWVPRLLRSKSHPWNSTRLPTRPGRGGTKREDQFLRPIQSAEGTRVATGDALGG